MPALLVHSGAGCGWLHRCARSGTFPHAREHLLRVPACAGAEDGGERVKVQEERARRGEVRGKEKKREWRAGRERGERIRATSEMTSHDQVREQ
eukprot:165258-Rhodomonas_salina.1